MKENMVWIPKNSSYAIATEDGLIEYYSSWCDNIQDVQFINDFELAITYIQEDSVCEEHFNAQDYCSCESYDYFSGRFVELWENRL